MQIVTTDKKNSRYQRLFSQLKELLGKQGNDLSRMATVIAVLHNKMEYYFWTGFYLISEGELIVGPYQGPPACQLLEKNKGVCWACINSQETVIVPNVHQFPGHIACDSRSNSEIVTLLKTPAGEIKGVLDIDSKLLAAFDQTDAKWLEKIVELIYSEAGHQPSAISG